MGHYISKAKYYLITKFQFLYATVAINIHQYKGGFALAINYITIKVCQTS